MTAPTFRSKNFYTGSDSGVEITEPAGASENDILYAHLLLWAAATLSSDPVTLYGWQVLKDLTATGGRYIHYWRRRGSSALTQNERTFSFSTSYYEFSITAWPGAPTTGSPWGATNLPAAASTGTTLDPGAVTTTANDSTIIASGAHWIGAPSGGWTAPSGYTIRESGGTAISIGVASKALTGETGTSQDPGSMGTTSSGEYYAITLELLSADPSGGGGTTTRNFTMMGLGS